MRDRCSPEIRSVFRLNSLLVPLAPNLPTHRTVPTNRTTLFALVTVLTGCSQGTPGQNTAAPSSAPHVSSSGALPHVSGSAPPLGGGLDDQQLEAKLADPSTLLTLELYEALLVRIAPCKLDGADPDWPKVTDCPALERFERETKRPSGDEGKLMVAGTGFRAKAQQIAIAKLASESRALRYVAADTIFLFPWDDVPGPMLAQLQVENDPSVRRVLLAKLAPSSEQRQSNDCAELAAIAELALADSAPKVRRLGLKIAGGRCVASARPALELKVAAIARADSEPTVRAQAYWALGAFETETSLNAISACLAAQLPTPQDGCLAGAIRRWTGSMVMPAIPSLPASQLTIDRLEAMGRAKTAASQQAQVDTLQLGTIAAQPLPTALTPAALTRLERALSSIVMLKVAASDARQQAGLALVNMKKQPAVTTLVSKLRANAKTDAAAVAVADFLQMWVSARP